MKISFSFETNDDISHWENDVPTADNESIDLVHTTHALLCFLQSVGFDHDSIAEAAVYAALRFQGADGPVKLIEEEVEEENE